MKTSGSAESPIGGSEGENLLPQPPTPEATHAPRATWSGLAAIIIWLASIGLNIALGVALGILQLFAGVTPPLLLTVVIGELLFLATPIIYVTAKRTGLTSLGLTTKGTLKAIAIGLPVGLAAWLAGYAASIPVELILPMPEWLIDYFRQLLPQTPLELLLIVLATFIVIAPCEEILSRGFVQQGMENSLGKRRGLLVASALFAILHLNPWQGVATFFMALILGHFFQRTGYNLATPIVAHAAANTISYTLSFLIGF